MVGNGSVLYFEVEHEIVELISMVSSRLLNNVSDSSDPVEDPGKIS